MGSKGTTGRISPSTTVWAVSRDRKRETKEWQRASGGREEHEGEQNGENKVGKESRRDIRTEGANTAGPKRRGYSICTPCPHCNHVLPWCHLWYQTSTPPLPATLTSLMEVSPIFWLSDHFYTPPRCGGTPTSIYLGSSFLWPPLSVALHPGPASHLHHLWHRTLAMPWPVIPHCCHLLVYPNHSISIAPWLCRDLWYHTAWSLLTTALHHGNALTFSTKALRRACPTLHCQWFCPTTIHLFPRLSHCTLAMLYACDMAPRPCFDLCWLWPCHISHLQWWTLPCCYVPNFSLAMVS